MQIADFKHTELLEEKPSGPENFGTAVSLSQPTFDSERGLTGAAPHLVGDRTLVFTNIYSITFVNFHPYGAFEL